MREIAKAAAAKVVHLGSAKCRFDKAIFLVSHMRAATTALSNVMCSHEQVSGYGEAHVAYTSEQALGQLLVNQVKRRAYRSSATYLFDKILHNRLDENAPDAFFEARAIFMLRAPTSTIVSIMNLAEKMGLNEYRSPEAAANYYHARVLQMSDLWTRFDAGRRLGLQTETLLEKPDREIGRIGNFLKLTPQLENAYASKKASVAHGAGDPLQSANHARIVAKPKRTDQPPDLDLDPERLSRCQNAHDHLKERFGMGDI